MEWKVFLLQQDSFLLTLFLDGIIFINILFGLLDNLTVSDQLVMLQPI
jgi:hypothetical protein